MLVADGREVTFALLCETLKEHFSHVHREHTAALELLWLCEKPRQYNDYRRQFDAQGAKRPTDKESLVKLLLVTLFKKGLHLELQLGSCSQLTQLIRITQVNTKAEVPLTHT